MRLRPTEVRMVAELLNEPAEDVEHLAERVIRALDEARASRVRYVALYLFPGLGYFVDGPYDTPHQARKAIEKAAAPGPGGRAGVYPMRPPEADAS